MAFGDPVRTRLLIAAVTALIGCVGVVSAAQVQGAPVSARGVGAFNADCEFSHRRADDPIVHPGKPGRSHLHDFFGNKSTDAFSTSDSLRANATNCHRQADRAAYWAPTLYNGDVSSPIRPTKASAYYATSKRDPASIRPFPEGLRMIAGDASSREKQSHRVQVVDWVCNESPTLDPGTSSPGSPRARELRAAVQKSERVTAHRRAKVRRLKRAIRRLRRAIRRQNSGRSASLRQRRKLASLRRRHRSSKRSLRRARAELTKRKQALNLYLVGGGTSIPTCKPGAHVVFVVQFPDCWDGRNLDSPDHKSHMEYTYDPGPDRLWVCPSTHPVMMPQLKVQVHYPTAGGPDIRLSPGDVDAGHADFMNGWDQQKLTQLVRDCLNADKYCGGGDKPVQKDPAASPSPSPSPPPPDDPLPLP